MPVRSLADHVHMQVGPLGMQRRSSFDQFAKAFLHVHASNVDDGLGGWVDVQLLSRLKPVPDVEDGEIATVDDGAGLLRPGTHGHSSSGADRR